MVESWKFASRLIFGRWIDWWWWIFNVFNILNTQHDAINSRGPKYPKLITREPKVVETWKFIIRLIFGRWIDWRWLIFENFNISTPQHDVISYNPYRAQTIEMANDVMLGSKYQKLQKFISINRFSVQILVWLQTFMIQPLLVL